MRAFSCRIPSFYISRHIAKKLFCPICPPYCQQFLRQNAPALFSVLSPTPFFVKNRIKTPCYFLFYRHFCSKLVFLKAIIIRSEKNMPNASIGGIRGFRQFGYWHLESMCYSLYGESLRNAAFSRAGNKRGNGGIKIYNWHF